METIETKAYKCQYCGSINLSQDDAVRCEMMCEAERMKTADWEKWFTDNKPKYEIGDVLKIDDIPGYDLNKYFVVTAVDRSPISYPKPTWIYFGEVGGWDSDNLLFNPDELGELPENRVHRIYTCKEFEAVKECVRRHITYGNVVSINVAHNTRRPAVSVLVHYDIDAIFKELNPPQIREPYRAWPASGFFEGDTDFNTAASMNLGE